MSLPPTHPLADIWPLMTDPEIDRLTEDIRQYGQRLPIIFADGMILDGRNRWLACERAEVKPWVQDVTGDFEALEALTWSLNEHRRHASVGVRAMAAARRANMKQGTRTDLTATTAKSQSEAANEFRVSVDSLQHAKIVLQSGSKLLMEAVESGDVAVSLAAKTIQHYKKTGEPITSIADLKNTMRRIFREENPDPDPEPDDAPPDPRPAPRDHMGNRTYGVVTEITRHAQDYPADQAGTRIDKWTRLNILDHLPVAIQYLIDLEQSLNGGGHDAG